MGRAGDGTATNTEKNMTAQNAAFFAKLINRANEHDTRWRESDRAVDRQFNTKTDDLVQGLIDDKFAQFNLIEAQRDQISALTTIIRALGHYTPGKRFHADEV